MPVDHDAVQESLVEYLLGHATLGGKQGDEDGGHHTHRAGFRGGEQTAVNTAQKDDHEQDDRPDLLGSRDEFFFVGLGRGGHQLRRTRPVMAYTQQYSSVSTMRGSART